MWSDYYLKFADAEEFAAAMPEAWQVASGPFHACDVIGLMCREDTGEDVAGYHVNLRLPAGEPLPEPLLAYQVVPEHPRRVFAA